jgi:hypothetical protein
MEDGKEENEENEGPPMRQAIVMERNLEMEVERSEGHHDLAVEDHKPSLRVRMPANLRLLLLVLWQQLHQPQQQLLLLLVLLLPIQTKKRPQPPPHQQQVHGQVESLCLKS